MLKEEELPKNLLQTPPKSFPPLASTQHPQNLSPKKEKEVEEDEEEKGSPSPRRQRSSAFSGLDNDFVKNFLSKCGLPLQSPSQESPRTKESQYQVKNIDTGTITDIRELEAKFMVLHETSNPAWGGYWREIKKKRERLWDSAEDGNLEALKALLLEKDCSLPLNVNAQCLDKWTALHLACNEGHLGVVELLAEHGADLEAKTSMERRPLHLVAMRGHVEILRFLLWKGCEVDAQAQDLNTPLHYAAERGNEEVVKELLNFGAKYDVKNEDQMTAFDLSLNRNVRNLFKEIVAGKNEDPFWRTSYGNCVRPNSRADYVKRLIFESQNLSLQPKKEENEEKNLRFSRIVIEKKEKIGPEDFDYYKILGKGSFGEVFLVKKKGGNKKYAMKILEKVKVCKKNIIGYTQSERNVLSVINHPFMVSLHSAFQTMDCLFLVLEFCHGGDLERQLRKRVKFTEPEARFYICEILLALESLHKSHIVYRDLKPANIVLDKQGHVKLTDFGLSKQGIEQNLTNSFCGSVAYLAPEILFKKGHNRTVDWYLLGMLMYELLVGTPAYYTRNKDALFENIKKGELLVPKSLSKEAKDLIKGLLCRDPNKRLGAKNDAEDIKKHPWFKDVDWVKVYNKEINPPLFHLKKIQLGSPLKHGFKREKGPLEKELENFSKVQNWTFIDNENI